MSDEPVTPSKYDTYSAYLAQQANEAIKAGADAKAVSAKLGEMVTHLHANPELHQHANEAMAKGVDPYHITTQLSEMMSQPPAPERPGVLSRAASQVGGFVKQAITHPGDTAAELIKAPVRSAVTMLSPGVGENRHSAALSKGGNSSGRPVDTTAYDAEHGGVTSGERTAAGVQTAANLLLPSASKLGVLGTIGGGAAAGAAYSRDDPMAGAITGGVLGGTLHGAGKVVKGVAKVTDAAASKALDLHGRPVDSRPAFTLPVINAPVGRITGLKDLAGEAIGRRAQMDAEAGHVAAPMHRSVPPLALDAAGPNVEGLAEGIANRPGPGRSQIVTAVEGRSKTMRPAISRTLEEDTGVPSDARMQPLEQAMAERSKVANEMYAQARAETNGIPIESPTFDDVVKTPAGRAAFEWAKVQKANRMRALPTIERPGGESGALREMVAQGVPHDKAVSALGDAAMEPSTKVEVPDAETLHFMKQHLAKTSRLGVNDGAQGTLATQADGALGRWGDIRGELPEPFQRADAAFAEHSRKIDAMDAGRNITRTRINPPGPARRAVRQSLDAVTKQHAGQPEAFQTGAATAAHNLLETAPTSTKSPGRIFARTPERIEQTKRAFPTPDKADDFQHAVNSWDRVQEQAQRLTGNSRTGLRGAEGSGAMVEPHTLMAGPKRIAKTIVKKIGGEAQKRHQMNLESEIAKLLSGSELPALPDRPAPNRLLQAVNGVGSAVNPATTLRENRP